MGYIKRIIIEMQNAGIPLTEENFQSFIKKRKEKSKATTYKLKYTGEDKYYPLYVQASSVHHAISQFKELYPDDEVKEKNLKEVRYH